MKKSKKAFIITACILLGLIFTLYILLPAGMGLFASFRQTTPPADPPDGFDAVSLTAQDGTALSCWYAPPQNGAVILLVHGSNGSLESVRGYADMLTGAGYGVLALGLRGHGSSGGGGNALGWECGMDIRAAADYLNTQSGVSAVGALGLSLGGEVLLAACGDTPEIQALVSDGATHHTLDDYLSLPANQSLFHSWTTRVMYASAQLFTGQQPPTTTIQESVSAAADTRFLLIAAEQETDEIDYNTLFADTADGRAELWVAPGSGHIQAFSLYPDEYAQRVTGFFDAALTQ